MRTKRGWTVGDPLFCNQDQATDLQARINPLRSFGDSRRCQPDSGKPTVRDERGARGNASYGGIRNPRRNRKGAGRSLSTYGCARPGSTRQQSGNHVA